MTAVSAQGVRTSLREAGLVGLGMALYSFLRLWGLHGHVPDGMYDEGVYLALMKLVAEGTGALYRDILCVPPPGAIHAGAWVWRAVDGDLYWMRFAYVAFCSLAVAPVYALARRLFGTRVALGTLFLMATTPALSGWLGRHIYLDLPLNVFLYTGIWLALRWPRSAWIAAAAGAVCASGYIVKATALPAVAAFAAALWIAGRPGPVCGAFRSASVPDTNERVADWRAFAIGATLALAPMLIALNRIPNYRFDTMATNAMRAYALAGRPQELLNGFYQMPLQMTLGVCGLLLALRRTPIPNRARSDQRRVNGSRPISDPAAVALGWFVVLCGVAMAVIPKAFYWRYLSPVAPALCMGVPLLWEPARPRGGGLRIAVVSVAVIGCIVHLATLVLYHASASRPVPAHMAATTVVRRLPGPVFSANPAWAVTAGRSLPPWRFAADTFMPHELRLADAEEYLRVLRKCPTAVLDRQTQRLVPPEVAQTIRREYASAFRHGTPGQRGYVEVFVQRRAEGSPLSDGSDESD